MKIELENIMLMMNRIGMSEKWVRVREQEKGSDALPCIYQQATVWARTPYIHTHFAVLPFPASKIR